MELCELLNKITVSPSAPQGGEVQVAAALTLCYDEIFECGVEILAAWSHKGTLHIVVEKGPAGRLECTHWPKLFQNICNAWRVATGYECTLEVTSYTHDWEIRLIEDSGNYSENN